MNDIHSQFELNYKPRWMASLLRDANKDHPIVVLTGARQVRKSTLLQREPPFSDWQYINLNNFDALSEAKKEPVSICPPDIVTKPR